MYTIFLFDFIFIGEERDEGEKRSKINNGTNGRKFEVVSNEPIAVFSLTTRPHSYSTMAERRNNKLLNSCRQFVTIIIVCFFLLCVSETHRSDKIVTIENDTARSEKSGSGYFCSTKSSTKHNWNGRGTEANSRWTKHQ